MIRQRPAPEPRARKRGQAKGPAGHPIHDAPPALVCPNDGRAASAQFGGLCYKCYQLRLSKPEATA